MKPSGFLRNFFCLSLIACVLAAHPMGKLSVSHYAKFQTVASGLELTYALDLAEVPAAEMLRDWKLERSSAAEQLQAKALEQMRTWVSNLAISVDGKPVTGVVKSADYAIRDGEENQPVIRITAKVAIDGGRGRVEYEDRNFPGRGGWKEVVTGSAADLSKGLTAYPETAPPQVLRASFESPGAPVQQADYLTELLRKGDLTFGMVLVGLAAAFGFGAMHALSPGHGKTIVAAYLVGSRGTMKHAMLLGAMVTITHTASVFALGLGTLFLSRYIVPDKIYPILSACSGLMIVFIGASMFYQRLKRAIGHSHGHGHHHHHHDHPHDHDHHHDHDHDHAVAHAHAPAKAHVHNGHTHDHGHDHGHSHKHDHGHRHDHGHDHHHHHGPGGHTHYVEGEVTMGNLVGLAVSGGLVPCPSALVLLLSAIAIGRIGLGLALLTSFSLGLALVLMAIGAMVLYAKDLLPDRPSFAQSPFFRMVPVISAGVITIVGLIMTAVALGWIRTPIG